MVEPDVLPLVVPVFSEAVQALKMTSDEHGSTPVSPVSYLRFIFMRKGRRKYYSQWLRGCTSEKVAIYSDLCLITSTLAS